MSPDTQLDDIDVPVEPVFYTYEPPQVVEPVEPVDSAPRVAPAGAVSEGRFWNRRWPTWQVVVAVGVALLVGVVVGDVTKASPGGRSTGAGTRASADRASSGAQTSSPDRRPAASGGASTTIAAASPGATMNGHAVLLNVPRHTGAMVTDRFTVTTPRWTLGWAYDCSGQGGTGSFNITVFDGSGGPSKDGGIDQQGAKGSSVVSYASTGERYLSVTTTCVWAIRVTT